MQNSTGITPRFGTDYLENWLAQPQPSGSEAEAQRQLARTVLTRGDRLERVEALGYSRDDWRLDFGHGRIATLTFQNMAQRDGTTPQQFVSCTLQVNGKQGEMLRTVQARAFHLNSDKMTDDHASSAGRGSSPARRLMALLQPRGVAAETKPAAATASAPALA